MNIQFKLWQQVCLYNLIFCLSNTVNAELPVYRVVKSTLASSGNPAAEDKIFILDLSLLNKTSSVAGYSYDPDPSVGNNSEGKAFRWSSADKKPTKLGVSGFNKGGHVSSTTRAINNQSTIVGFETNWGNGNLVGPINKAVVWGAHDIIPTILEPLSLGDTGYEYSSADAINNSGVMVGSSLLYEKGLDKGLRAVRWRSIDKKPMNLGTLGVNSAGEGHSLAIAINKRGIVVGESDLYENSIEKGGRAVRWGPNDNKPTNLGTLGVDINGFGFSTAVAVNDNGVVIGNSWLYEDGVFKGTRAVRWNPRDTKPVNLTALTYSDYYNSNSSAIAINGSGVIIGTSSLLNAGPPPAKSIIDGVTTIRWGVSDTSPVDQGTLGKSGQYGWVFSDPKDINNSGIIVGRSRQKFSLDDYRAVLWDKTGGIYDLNQLLDPAQQAEWKLLDAVSINNSGVILAVGIKNNINYYVILEPQSNTNSDAV